VLVGRPGGVADGRRRVRLGLERLEQRGQPGGGAGVQRVADGQFLQPRDRFP